MSEQVDGTASRRQRWLSEASVVLVAAVLLGAAMRFYRLGALPPGLYHDEAFNGLDALRVLGGERPVFFEANNGREPLFLYSQALSVSLWGRTPFALRLPAAVLGTLTIPAAFWLGKALFGRKARRKCSERSWVLLRMTLSLF